MKISIIIPVYNTASDLRRCLDSVLAQSFKDWECICVDDGSTDGSSRILDEYAGLDSRYHIIHQENMGTARTRQRGLEAATGEWVAWIDSDDWVEVNHLRDLYLSALESDADMVFEDYWTVSDGEKTRTTAGRAKTAQQLMLDILQGRVWGVLYNRLYRRKFITDNKIAFPPSPCNIEEDVCFNSSFLTKNPIVVRIDSCDYHYVIRHGSMIHSTMTLKHILNYVAVREYLMQCVDSDEARDAVRILAEKTKLHMFFSPNVSNALFVSTFPEIRHIDYQTAKAFHRILFWLAVRGWRNECLFFWNCIHSVLQQIRRLKCKYE